MIDEYKIQPGQVFTDGRTLILKVLSRDLGVVKVEVLNALRLFKLKRVVVNGVLRTQRIPVVGNQYNDSVYSIANWATRQLTAVEGREWSLALDMGRLRLSADENALLAAMECAHIGTWRTMDVFEIGSQAKCRPGLASLRKKGLWEDVGPDSGRLTDFGRALMHWRFATLD